MNYLAVLTRAPESERDTRFRSNNCQACMEWGKAMRERYPGSKIDIFHLSWDLVATIEQI